MIFEMRTYLLKPGTALKAEEAFGVASDKKRFDAKLPKDTEVVH